MEDVICFIANIIAMGRFWVKVNDEESPMVLNIYIDIADIISSAKYRSFDDKYKGSTKYMAHTLVVYILNIFAVFVKAANTQKVIREFQLSNEIKFRYLRMARVTKGNLMEQLNLCVVTSSRQVLFNCVPITFKLFYPSMVKEDATSIDNGNDKKRSFDKVNGD